MNSRNRALVVIIVLLIMVIRIQAQEAEKQKPLTLRDYRIVQYIQTDGKHYSPYRIFGLDNNGAVLDACREGKTKTQLVEMGLPVIDSQILFLESYGLLTYKDKVIKTAFPILDADKTQRMRELTKRVAPDLAEYIRSDVSELISLLKKTGRDKNAYSILFAYVVDGLIWDVFEREGLVPPIEITAERPFWAGEIWAFYPPRNFSCGTNTYSIGRYALKFNWSRTGMSIIRPFFGVLRALDNEVFKQFADKGFIEDSKAKATLLPYGIFDDSDSLRIPIIEEDEENELYRVSLSIARRIAEKSLSLLAPDEMNALYDFRDVQQAMVVVFHELMWDLMGVLEEQGIIQKPVVFANPEEASSEDIVDLLLIVKKEPRREMNVLINRALNINNHPIILGDKHED